MVPWRWLVPLLAVSAVGYSASTSGRRTLSVGEPFRIDLPKGSQTSGELPDWVHTNGTNLIGVVPHDARRTTYSVALKGSPSLELTVTSEPPTSCVDDEGNPLAQEWVDIGRQGEPAANVEFVIELADTINARLPIFRVLPWDIAYGSARNLTQKADLERKTDTIVWVAVPCSEDVGEWMAAIVEPVDDPFGQSTGRIGEDRSTRAEDANGVLSGLNTDDMSTDEPEGEEEQFTKTTTQASTTTTRNARAMTTSARLVSLNPINGGKPITCTAGQLCSAELDARVFLGGTCNTPCLDLEIKRSGPLPGAAEDDTYDGMHIHTRVDEAKKKAYIRLLALRKGTYTFTIVARLPDSRGTSPATSSFTVEVKEPAKPALYGFEIEVDTPRYVDTAPLTSSSVYDFMEKWAAAIPGGDAKKIRVLSITGRPGNSAGSIITYTDTGITPKDCKKDSLKGIIDAYLMKKTHKIKLEVQKKLANNVVEHVYLRWFGECEAKHPDQKPVEKTQKEDVEAAAESAMPIILIVVLVIAALLILLIAIACCLVCKKNTRRSDYMTKGTPVVFPEEVDDENENTPATAPMLVREERPPIKISQHDNPLYKPPPPLTAASPRPTPAPLSASTQRLPPPYVPP